MFETESFSTTLDTRRRGFETVRTVGSWRLAVGRGRRSANRELPTANSSVARFVFRGELADGVPQPGEQRLARSHLELRGGNSFQGEDLRADDAEGQPHVRKAPVQERLVVVHHRLNEPKQLGVIARRAFDLNERGAAPPQELFERRPEALANIQQFRETRRFLPAPAPQRG